LDAAASLSKGDDSSYGTGKKDYPSGIWITEDSHAEIHCSGQTLQGIPSGKDDRAGQKPQDKSRVHLPESDGESNGHQRRQ